jgi:hypothetical protein
MREILSFGLFLLVSVLPIVILAVICMFTERK